MTSPLALAGVCLLSVLSLCSAAATYPMLAVAPCNQTIIDNIKKIRDCYDPKHPPQQLAIDERHTIVMTSAKVQDNVNCISYWEQPGKSIMTVVSKKLKRPQLELDHDRNADYILETAAGGGEEGARPEMNIAFDCIMKGGEHSDAGKLMVAMKYIAKSCFQKLGVHHLTEIPSCWC